MIRLRQVALVARDLDAVSAELAEHLSLVPCFHDPGVGEFGLHNALYPIGDQLLEVVSPVEPGTTAGRLLDKRGGDGGYMAIFETDDLDRDMGVANAAGVRVVWEIDLDDIRGRHMHPRDVGGAIVSIDQPVPQGSWRWAGPKWVAHSQRDVVSAIAGVTISASDPDATRARWTELGIAGDVAFRPASDRGNGLDEIDLVATQRERAGEMFTISGVVFRLV